VAKRTSASLFLLLLPLAELSAPAAAVAADEIEVDVAAEREPKETHPDPTATTSGVAKERIERARDRGEALSELADTVAGARVLDLGGPVGARIFTVRGGAPDQALVIVDGVAARSPFSTGFDVGQLSLESIDSISLVRGGAGATLGEGALSGALIVTTKKATETAEQSMLLSYGSFRTTRVSGAASKAPISVSAAFERSDGDFTYESRIRGLPSVELVRRNNDATRGSLSLRADADILGASASLIGGASYREAGVPGLETQADSTARERRGSGRIRAALERKLESERAPDAFALALSLDALDIDYRDDDPTGLRALRSTTKFYTATMESSLVRSLFGAQLLRVRASAGAERSDSTEHGSPSRYRGRAAASDELFAGDFTIFGALAAEAITNERLALLPRIGARWAPSPIVSARAALGRSLHAPSIDALYHPSEAGFSGNPDLRAETAWEAETALALEAPDLPSVTVTAFGRLVSDVILYVNDDAFVIRPRNEGDARAAGAELEVAYRRRFGGLRAVLDGSAAVLFSELAATKRELPTQPKWSAAGELVLELGPVSLGSRVRALSPTTANLQGTLEVERYLRWDEVLSVRATETAIVSLSVLNVLDDRALESIYKLPLPGRTVFLSVRASS
jgi:vitamin B12 transporter